MTTTTIEDEVSALDKYINILQALGANDSNILRRRTFISALLKELDQLPQTEKVYGAVVEERLKSFSQEETRHFFQTTARDFYHFWINDEPKINSLVQNNELSVIPFRITIPGPIDDLIESSKVYCTGRTLRGVEKYRQLLVDSSIQQSHIDMRLAWIGLVLYTMSEFEPTPDNFRAAAEAVSLKFDSNIQRQSFFVIIREFYSFWSAEL